MAVTLTQSMHHKSQIHDGFATIRSTRSRVRLKESTDLVQTSPSRHGEYFTIRRNNKQTFLDNNNIDKLLKKEAAEIQANNGSVFNYTNEPIYAKVSPPQSNENSPSKKQKSEVHYDSINIKPNRNGQHRKERSKHRDKELTEVRVTPFVKVTTSSSEDDLIENYSKKMNGSNLISNGFDKPMNGYGKVKEEFEFSDYQTDTTLVESDDASIITKDSDDVLKDLPDLYRFHRSPQKYATLNSRRPKSIDLKPNVDNQYYGSLNRSKIGYRSEPNTPINPEARDFAKCVNGVPPLPSPMELKNYDANSFIYHKKNGVRRSNSEIGSTFYNGRLPHSSLPNYRHSVSVDVSSMGGPSKNHVCCECVTGIPGRSTLTRSTTSGHFSQTLDTLYESQDPKVGCQTILRSKPPVPWWDLAIRKTRYQSCPILDEVTRRLHNIMFFSRLSSEWTQLMFLLLHPCARTRSTGRVRLV